MNRQWDYLYLDVCNSDSVRDDKCVGGKVSYIDYQKGYVKSILSDLLCQ